MKKKFLSMALASGLALTGVFGGIPSVYAGTTSNQVKEVKDEVLFSDDFENGIDPEWSYESVYLKDNEDNHYLEFSNAGVASLFLYPEPNTDYEITFKAGLSGASLGNDYIRLSILYNYIKPSINHVYENIGLEEKTVRFNSGDSGDLIYISFFKHFRTSESDIKGMLDNVVLKKITDI